MRDAIPSSSISGRGGCKLIGGPNEYGFSGKCLALPAQTGLIEKALKTQRTIGAPQAPIHARGRVLDRTAKRHWSGENFLIKPEKVSERYRKNGFVCSGERIKAKFVLEPSDQNCKTKAIRGRIPATQFRRRVARVFCLAPEQYTRFRK